MENESAEGVSTESIALWAMDLRFINLMLESEDQRLRLITVPRATIPNLHAQHGIFLLENRAVYSTSIGGYVPLDSVVCEQADYWIDCKGF